MNAQEAQPVPGPDGGAAVKPTIALVQGDAAGVGPELMTRLLDLEDVRERANILVVSDARVFRAGCEVTGLEPPIREIVAVADADYAGGAPNLLDVPAVDPAQAPRGKVSVAAGAAVLKWFGRALDLAMDGWVDGICFMPFNKQAMHKAGLDAEDELQWARARLGYDGRASEFNVVDGMCNARVTSHVPEWRRGLEHHQRGPDRPGKGRSVADHRQRRCDGVQADVLERVPDAVRSVEERQERHTEDDEPHQRVVEQRVELVEVHAPGGDDEARDDDQHR